MLLCWGNWVKPVKISSKTSSNPLKPVANWKNRFLSFLNYSTVVKDVSLLVKGKILSDCKFSVYLLFKKKEFDEKKLLQYKFSMAKYMIFSF